MNTRRSAAAATTRPAAHPPKSEATAGRKPSSTASTSRVPPRPSAPKPINRPAVVSPKSQSPPHLVPVKRPSPAQPPTVRVVPKRQIVASSSGKQNVLQKPLTAQTAVKRPGAPNAKPQNPMIRSVQPVTTGRAPVGRPPTSRLAPPAPLPQHRYRSGPEARSLIHRRFVQSMAADKRKRQEDAQEVDFEDEEDPSFLTEAIGNLEEESAEDDDGFARSKTPPAKLKQVRQMHQQMQIARRRDRQQLYKQVAVERPSLSPPQHKEAKQQQRFSSTDNKQMLACSKRKTGNVGASDDIDVTSAPSPAPETVPVCPPDLDEFRDDFYRQEEDTVPPPKRPKLGPSTVVSVTRHGPVGVHQLSPPTRRITVDAPAPLKEEPFVETSLPGVANEVESYPCKFCPDRIFLTSFGLEKHTIADHPGRLQETMEEISRIEEEWKRREKEREKQRERLALAKIRQEALAAAAAREALQKAVFGRYSLERRLGGEQGVSYGGQGGDQSSMTIRQSNFESCVICGLLINSEHPTAMENHMRAHKKNDELREHLLNTFGTDFVARVTCHECQLVFTDERKLISHAEAMHVRRRKYVCKWCGHICLTMTELNNHKADVHGMPVSRSRDPEIRRARQLASLTKGRGMPPLLGVQSAGTRRAVAMAEAVRAQHANGSNPRVLTSVEELPCRTTCDFCGLVMVKPSLLIRHMMRVHNRTNFSATVETKGMPSFKINVDRGKLSWDCCEETYVDRGQFVQHRRANHAPKLPPTKALPLNREAFDPDLHSNQQTAVTATGEDGQQYIVLMTNEDGTTEEGREGGEQQIVLTAEQLGITGDDADNVLVLIDDGSGNMTLPDGTQVVLEQETGGDGEEVTVEEKKDESNDKKEEVQVMINEKGEVQLVEEF